MEMKEFGPPGARPWQPLGSADEYFIYGRTIYQKNMSILLLDMRILGSVRVNA